MSGCTLYYFTGTGNTLWLARRLAAALPEEATLVAMAGLPEDEPVVCRREAAGILFPVYGFGMPLLVQRFVRRLETPAGATLFGVADCASLAGGALNQLRALLAERGRDLRAGWVVKLPGNFTPLYGAEKEATQRRKFARAEERIAAVAEAVAARRDGPLETARPPLSWLSRLGQRLAAWQMPRADRRFTVDERCTRCGRCARVCPVGNIVLEDDRPVWQHRCEQCMACLQWCPTEAIDCGRLTRGRTRYHHPEVTVHEMLERRRAAAPPPDGPGAETAAEEA